MAGDRDIHHPELLRKVTLEEAKKNKKYWAAIGYRIERISRYIFLGKLQNSIFVRDFLATNPEYKPTEIDELRAKVLQEHLDRTLLFSTNDSFAKLQSKGLSRMIAPELKDINIRDIPDERLRKLIIDISDEAYLAEQIQTEKGLSEIIMKRLNNIGRDIEEKNLSVIKA